MKEGKNGERKCAKSNYLMVNFYSLYLFIFFLLTLNK